jgi:hypothetical protein
VESKSKWKLSSVLKPFFENALNYTKIRNTIDLESRNARAGRILTHPLHIHSYAYNGIFRIYWFRDKALEFILSYFLFESARTIVVILIEAIHGFPLQLQANVTIKHPLGHNSSLPYPFSVILHRKTAIVRA